MDNRSNAAVHEDSGPGVGSVLQIREEWRLARGAYKELQIAGMPDANLLLVGTPGTIRIIIEMLWLELHEPILTWRPGQRLELPDRGRVGTLVLHDVHALTASEQRRVLDWLDQTGGQIRVVSTTGSPLWRRVKAGAFDDVLYYRLNTVSAGVVM
jgi:hypothetical protein